MEQHWGMLLFESLSAGVMAILIGFVTVLIAVSLYAIFVWPLTFWDLANLGLERYGSWVKPILWAVFWSASAVGYWFFSGAAFKRQAKAAAARAGAVRPRP